jgi:cell division initiation protein
MKSIIKGMTLLLAGVMVMACSKDVAFDENAQKEAKKIINDAKLQSKEMVDSAKTEQMRLAEQSASECERIVKEHKEKCAQLIRDNTAITENKINTIRAAYEDELARYKQLQADVTYFKSNLIELYKQQIQLVMDLPTMTEEELDEYESQFESDESFDQSSAQEASAVQAPINDEPVKQEPAEQQPVQSENSEEERVEKILNTGSFEPVIPKSTLNDLQFGKNN